MVRTLNKTISMDIEVEAQIKEHVEKNKMSFSAFMQKIALEELKKENERETGDIANN
jgi:hypothetical protein